jgi:queuine tRNA-ribosyltransferase
MQGLRDAIAAGKLDAFVADFYQKRGMDVPALDALPPMPATEQA